MPSRRKLSQRIVPICVLLGMGYYNFSYCYELGYKEVYKFHSKGVGISLWIISAWCQLCLFSYWIALVLRGPGKVPQIEPFDLTSREVLNEKLPKYFICDSNGYPYWCGNCQSLKPPRTLHSSDLNRCVPRFDHYCIWIGSLIGEGNYAFFIKFAIYYYLNFLTSLIYLARFTNSNIKRGNNQINNNYIVLYIFSAFWIIMLMGLILEHFFYITINATTIDRLIYNDSRKYQRWKEKPKRKFLIFNIPNPRKEDGIRYINVAHEDSRAVISYSVGQNIYNNGFKNNFISIFKPQHQKNSQSNASFSSTLLLSLIPFFDIFSSFAGQYGKYKSDSEEKLDRSTELYEEFSDALGEEFSNYIAEQLSNGNFTVASYLKSL